MALAEIDLHGDACPPDAAHLLTATALSVARTCARKYHYRYELGFESTSEKEALTFGKLTHRGLEAWWEVWRQSPTTAVNDALAAALAALPDTTDSYVHARLRAMLTGYDVRWRGWAATVEVLAVEVRFELPLFNPVDGSPSATWRRSGRLDLIVRLDDGRIAIVEHKSTSDDPSPGSLYRDRLTLDAQVSQYFDGADALGWPADLCVYDVLVKPDLRPLKATPPEKRTYKKDGSLYANQRAEDETPAEYFQRCTDKISELDGPNRFYQHAEIVRLADEREAFAWDIWLVAAQIDAFAAAGHAPRNPDACDRYGSACPYLDVCRGRASLEDPTRFRRLPTVHPELSTEGDSR